jgi:UDP-N-acetylmuramate dehydrogenase
VAGTSAYEYVSARLRGDVKRDEPLSRHTSLKVGGPADCFALPADQDDLRALVESLQQEGIPWFVIGGGYNLLARDGGFRGVAISLARLNAIEQQGQLVIAGAGTFNGVLVRSAQRAALAGLEFLIGIPGSVGGALAMNAGAHGEAILDRGTRLTTMTDGVIRVREKADLRYGYRFLDLAPGEIILGAAFTLEPGDPVALEERIEGFLAHRRHAQRVSQPSAGCFFKNPQGEHAWRLIDQAGMRGCRVGGAQVSAVHANFLVNRGGARAQDFLRLAALVKEKVMATSGIALEEEVRIVGED